MPAFLREIESLSDQMATHKKQLADMEKAAEEREAEIKDELDKLQIDIGRRDRDVKVGNS